MANPPNIQLSVASLVNTIEERDILEGKILNLHASLKKLNVSMTEPLIDSDGYPRNDIDIPAIRHIRHEIICKQNDCKNLTKKIEEDLYALHAESKIVPTESCKLKAKEVCSNKPFAEVDMVDPNSPAQKADIRVGDLIVKFGKYKSSNLENLSVITDTVLENLRKPIHVNVLREGKVIPLILVPDDWDGPGFVGCKIHTV